MSIDIRFPNITAKDEAGQISQMKSYLHQLAEQLNWALNTVEDAKGGNASSAVKFVQSKNITQQEAADTFNSIKALIIKSAEIVKAYEETIRTNFNGTYFADSDFGTYMQYTQRSIEESSQGVKEVYSNIQKITNKDGTGSLDMLKEETRSINAYIKRGFLDYDESGNAVHGIEVGDTSEDGSFTRYARFTADRLSFFDENNSEVAYIGAGCLYVVGKTVFLGEIQLGSYSTDTSDGLAFTWIGG